MRVTALVAVLVLSTLLPERCWARSSGAPAGACGRIFPEGHLAAGSDSQDLATNPFTLDISALCGVYDPGETYMLTLTGNTISFRGLMVQARAVADDTPLGSFQAEPDVTRLSDCSRADSAITHSNAAEKTTVQLPFTAPPAGSGPLRFVYAVVQRFITYYAPVESAMVQEGPVEVMFIGGTPLVTDNDITVRLMVEPPVPLLCQVVTRSQPGMPVISHEQDCSSGEVTFLNVESGRHRVRVIAGERHDVIRSRLVIMPDDANFCSLNAINNGVTANLLANGTIISYTIEFQSIGFNAGFVCFVPRNSPQSEPCTSPFTVPAREGVDTVKVSPVPTRCPGRRRPLVFRLRP